MEKSRRGMWKLLRSQENPAITQFFSYSIAAGKRLYLLKPHSGKTHQLRVALSSIGSPILGDPIYATKNAYKEQRGYLHAYALKFTFQSQDYNFVLPPNCGEYFIESLPLTELDSPWDLPWPTL